MAATNDDYKFDSVDLIFYLWDRKRPIIMFTTLAAVVSILVALLVPVKYKSEVILFPTASSSVSYDLLSVNISKKDILKLGEDEEVEQMLQVLQSDEIRDRIIAKYHLMEHYKIDSNSKYPQTTLYKKFAKNITFTPTKFLSVKISVLDQNAKLAADIANDIASLVDTVRITMQKERALEALNLVKIEYLLVQDRIKLLEDSLMVFNSMGIIQFESQVERLTEAYGKALIEGNKSAADKIQEKLELFSKYGGTAMALRQNVFQEKELLSNLQAKYSEAMVDATQKLPTKFVVNKAVKAEKKSYPIRWLIVVLSTLSTFILTVLLLVVYESIVKRMNEIKALDAK
ncbi:MAG: Wzz/FepE/Etk N-terminal domain-containing protein [Salinivirgaceae bacterium]